MSYSAPKGLFDLLPGQKEWRDSELWQIVEEQIRETAQEYGFHEIRTPIFEKTELFIRSVGESSDIVSKEMYSFLDKGERSMTLRPEGTAPVMRALVESKVLNDNSNQKVFYIGPMFRYERPQAGRYRQHHQFGVEAIGCNAPEQDAEVIDLLMMLSDKLGLKNLTVQINSIGNHESRNRFRDMLRNYLRPNLNELSEDSQRRFESNPLRILDSKDKTDRKFLEGAPSILDALDSESADHFEHVKKLLDSIDRSYIVNPQLVRGLDYYNGTVFEVMTENLGAQNSIGGGGRYDGLIKELGGPDVPSMGFGAGLERIIQTMISQEVNLTEETGPLLYLVPLGDEARLACFGQLNELRNCGISAEMDFTGRKLRKVMSHANKIKAEFVAVVGEEEMKNDQVELKEMASGESRTISFSKLPIEIMQQFSTGQEELLQDMAGQLMQLLNVNEKEK